MTLFMCRVFRCGYISTSLFAAGLLALISGSTAHAQVEVWVEGGQEDRPVAVVTFTVAGVSGSWHAVDSLGRTASMQVSRSGQAQLVLADLRAGERRWLHLRPAVAARPRVIVERAGHLASFRVDDRPMMAYHMEKGPMPRSDIDSIYHRAGYLHPVYTPGGRLVTDDYPPNHIHHHGIWAAWTRTRFQGRTPDFWNMGRGTGRVDVSSIDSLWSGAVSGGVRAEHRYVDLAGRTVALYETWQVEAYATELPLNIFDLTLWQRTAGDSALSLSEHLYGGMGLRGHRDWNGEEHADFLTSEGRTRADGHATRARWCHVGGRVEGERVGIAVLGHPDNLEAPQPMRIHPSEPFFNYAPSQAGEFHIRPGTVTRWRYRFVIYDGPPDPLLLEALWTDFAQPARVSIVN